MIGIFDSGIGGLTVVRALRKRRPDLSLLYLGDTARSPYGTKSPETVARYAEAASRFLIDQGATKIIIACNTASSLATDHLRKIFPQTPFFEVISPAVKAAVESTKTKKIGVIGTRATINSGIYEKRINAANASIQVSAAAAPLLVTLVEEGWMTEPETASIVGKYLAPIKAAAVDTLILGCTHYPLLKPLIGEFMGAGVKLIDSAEEVTNVFRATIEKEENVPMALTGAVVRYFATDPSETFQKVASEWMGESVRVERAEY
jgi:glutamate racemase